LVPFPDRNRVAVALDAPPGYLVRFFEVRGDAGRPVPGGEFRVSVPSLYGLAFSSDGRRAVGGTFHKAVPLVVADLDADGRVTRVREPHKDRSFLLDGRTRDGRFVLSPPGVLDLETEAVVAEVADPGAVGCTLSPDGRWVATGDGKGTIRLWDVSRVTAPKR
jgi:WD40 repeat protein